MQSILLTKDGSAAEVAVIDGELDDEGEAVWCGLLASHDPGGVSGLLAGEGVHEEVGVQHAAVHQVLGLAGGGLKRQRHCKSHRPWLKILCSYGSRGREGQDDEELHDWSGESGETHGLTWAVHDFLYFCLLWVQGGANNRGDRLGIPR